MDTTTAQVKIPTVHSNGTGFPTLMAQLNSVVVALEHALDAMSEATPHGRDYYVQGDNTINIARDDHANRRYKINDVLTEIEEVRYGIYQQREGKPTTGAGYEWKGAQQHEM